MFTINFVCVYVCIFVVVEVHEQYCVHTRAHLKICDKIEASHYHVLEFVIVHWATHIPKQNEPIWLTKSFIANGLRAKFLFQFSVTFENCFCYCCCFFLFVIKFKWTHCTRNYICTNLGFKNQLLRFGSDCVWWWELFVWNSCLKFVEFCGRKISISSVYFIMNIKVYSTHHISLHSHLHSQQLSVS